MARTWQLRNECWQLPEMGALMGILNVTPDSFSDGGQHYTRKDALAHAQRLINEGADIIDIGGESTRPGAAPVPPVEERRRVLPIIRALRKKHPNLRISIDTRNPSTARAALKAGADIINDISGLANPAMLALCAEQPCGIVIMHMQGEPATMQKAPYYLDIVKEIRAFFTERLEAAQAAGIAAERICLDPGIGFGKKSEHNVKLIHELADLRVNDRPLLMGLSRKRFLESFHEDIPDTLGINKTIPRPIPPQGQPEPTIAMSMLAAENGADIHRVHDVKEHRNVLRLRYLEYKRRPASTWVKPRLTPRRSTPAQAQDESQPQTESQSSADS